MPLKYTEHNGAIRFLNSYIQVFQYGTKIVYICTILYGPYENAAQCMTHDIRSLKVYDPGRKNTILTENIRS